MKRFDYLAPNSLAEALEMLSDRPEAVPLAGGTDLLVQIKEGRRPVEALLSLKRVPGLGGCAHNGALTLGSTVTVGQIAAHQQVQQDYAALATGAGLIGSVQIRNVATVGGNLCNAAPSADTAPPLLVLGAQAVIASAQGQRTLPLETFFLPQGHWDGVGPGRTALGPGELLQEIIVPQPARRSGSFYVRHTPRARMDLAVVGVAAAITLDGDGTIAAARLALGAVAPVPMRATEAEALLPGQALTEELLQEVGALAAQQARPIDDLRASAAYRRHLVNVLTQRALRGALARAKDE
jgi:CO/xanthine dehydrogenase FAD-binding subunit